MGRAGQLTLFETDVASERNSSTFVDNMRLPVHRWFRYSAGFSAQWAEKTITEHRARCVLDPFAGSGTSLLAAEDAGALGIGIESHPFVSRVARAKLQRRGDPNEYRDAAKAVLQNAEQRSPSDEVYPPLIGKCYSPEALGDLDRLRCAVRDSDDGSAASELVWLTLVSILRQTSHVGTANWQYVLPNKTKKNVKRPLEAFETQMHVFYRDMLASRHAPGAPAKLVIGDARTCEGVESGSVDLVVTSPPYPNNYDYADATRLEMTFLREIDGWGELHSTVRRHLVCSCSQHVSERSEDLEALIAQPAVAPIAAELGDVCRELAQVRLTKGGKKAYHLMIARYFLDLAATWRALRRVCASPCRICFVLGDSAPYGVHVPVPDWLGRLAVFAGFDHFSFERIRDRNTKWKNRKHRVPLCEGRLWVTG